VSTVLDSVCLVVWLPRISGYGEDMSAGERTTEDGELLRMPRLKLPPIPFFQRGNLLGSDSLICGGESKEHAFADPAACFIEQRPFWEGLSSKEEVSIISFLA
jgi:hypothetical protein